MNSNYHNIYLFGGHALAFSYFQKLQTAKSENLISYENIYCIDADEHAHAAKIIPDHLIKKTPVQFILNYLDQPQNYHPDDIIVPDHTAKHIFLGVFLDLVKTKFPNLQTQLKTFQADFTTPFLHKSENDAIWAMSYATWRCPSECQEPNICPHTNANRDWDFNQSLPELMKSFSDTTYSTHLFFCEQLVHAISKIPLTKVIAEVSQFIYALQTQPPQKVIVVTYSHCHGILGQFEINRSS